MGEFYSKPAPPTSQVVHSNPLNSRFREHAPKSNTTGSDHSNPVLESLSRFQSANNLSSNAMPLGSQPVSNSEQPYAASVNRNGRLDINNNNLFHPSLTQEDMFAAAHLYSQLSPSQLSALATAYHHQQQQLQRSTGSIGVQGANYNPRMTQAPSTHSHNQKRPPSIQSQFQSGHTNQPASISSITRPASASQAALHRNSHTIPPNFSHLNPHINLPQPMPTSHLDPNTLNLLGAHHQNRVSPSPSLSPVNNTGYQGRRSQLAPPLSVHPSKRPRISNSAQQSHPVSMLPTGHNINICAASGMEALMNSVAAGKSVANANFLNPSIYSAATEAAFYSLINANNQSNTSTANTTSNQLPFHSSLQAHHHQRSGGLTGNNVLNASHAFHQPHLVPPVSTFPTSHMPPLSVSLLNSFGAGRSSYSHGLGLTPQAMSSGQTNASVVGFGSQHNPNHIPVSHLASKPSQQPAVGQSSSRLMSSHLHHSHLPTQHNFHHQNHSLPQVNTQHHMMGHANLSQGSGVLRQQTKEPAYHPQVEAISPAPDESRLADAQDAKLHREREEINRQLTVLDTDINKQESHLRNLCEREARLAARLISTPTRRNVPAATLRASPYLKDKSTDVLNEQNGPTRMDVDKKITDTERTYENPIQAIISDNRQRTKQRHLIFTRLCGTKVKPGPFSLPLYRQPSDLYSICAIRLKFRNGFRDKLITYLRRRFRAEQGRIRLLAQHYSRHSKIFTKKMNKILSSTKRRQRDLRYRDIFEKALPEVKKNREDREMTGTEYSKSGMDDDSSNMSGNMVDGSQATAYDPIEEMSKFKEYAIDPPIMLEPWQRRYQFVCESGIVADCRAELQEAQDLSKWSEEEKQIFKERFLTTPKNFVSISAHLERKTVAECIHYYYLSKKKEGYKQLLKKHNARRRRAAPTERGGGSGSGGNNASNNTGGSNSGGGNTGSTTGNNIGIGNGNLPPTSFSNGHSAITSPQVDSSLLNDKELTGDDAITDLGVTKTELFLSKGSNRNSSGGLRCRPGRGRPPAIHNISNNDDTNQASNTKTRTSGNGARSGRDQINASLSTGIKDPNLAVSTKDMTSLNCTTSTSSAIAPIPTMATGISLSNNVGNKSGSCGFESTSTIRTDDNTDNANTTSNILNVNTNLSACIKDLIHFAIEKNLTKPSLNCSNSTGSSESWPIQTDGCVKSGSEEYGLQLAKSEDYQLINKFNDSKTSCHLGDVGVDCQRDGVASKSKSKHGSVRLEDQNELLSPFVFPSTTAAEIYAAAARFAAASANPDTMNNDSATMHFMASVVAAAKSTTTVNFATRTLHGSSTTEIDSMHSRQSNVDSLKRLNSMWPNFDTRQTTCSADPMTTRPIDAGVSSKAILIGDFLTAKQLGRTDSSNWNTTAGTNSSNISNPIVSEFDTSRAINPNSLPIPLMRPTPCSISETHNRLAESSFLEKSLTNDLLAEHALRLAMRAKVAAATAANTSIDCKDGVPTSFPNSLDQSLSSGRNNERCVYSPLSPTPIKTDTGRHSPCKTTSGGSSTDSLYPSLPILFGPQRDSTSSPTTLVKPESDGQVASFINSAAKKRYLDELGPRERSDSMRTLTSSEASQFYGVLHHMRQHANNLRTNLHSDLLTRDLAQSNSNVFARPQSSEASVPFDGTRLEHEVSESHQNTYYDQLPENKFGLTSSIFLKESLDDACLLSNLKRAQMLQDSAPYDHLSLLEARYRRRGYTESQINLRPSLSPNVSKTTFPVSMCSALEASNNRLSSGQFESSLSDNKDASTTFTTAKYIDDLIYCHLNRSSRTIENLPNSVVSSGLNNADIGTINSTRSDACKQASSTGQDAVRSHLSDYSSNKRSSTFTSSICSISGSNSSSNGSSGTTLENQINKAIVEELRAQITPKNANSSRSLTAVGYLSSHYSRSPSPRNYCLAASTGVPKDIHHQTNAIAIPFKKRDRNNSLSPTSPNLTDSPNEKAKAVVDKDSISLSNSSVIPSTDNTIESMEPIDSTNSDLSHSAIVNGAIDILPEEEDKSCTKIDGESTCDIANSPVSSASDHTTVQGADYDNSQVTQCTNVDESIVNHSPSYVSDVESPGELQIDLATSDCSPTIVNASSFNDKSSLLTFNSASDASALKQLKDSTRSDDKQPVTSVPSVIDKSKLLSNSLSTTHLNCLKTDNHSSPSCTCIDSNSADGTSVAAAAAAAASLGINYLSAASISNASTIITSSV